MERCSFARSYRFMHLHYNDRQEYNNHWHESNGLLAIVCHMRPSSYGCTDHAHAQASLRCQTRVGLLLLLD